MIRRWSVRNARLGGSWFQWSWFDLRWWGSWCSRRELAHSNWICCGWLIHHQCATFVTNGQRAIQALLDQDASAGITDAVRAGWDLQALAIERDGVIVGDSTPVLEAEDIFPSQVLRPGAIG